MTARENNFAKNKTIPKEIIPEEFPEGPYGSSVNSDKTLENTEEKDPRPTMSPYAYPEKGLQRQVPGAYPVKDRNEH